jgi:hypothetical protein
MGLDPQLDANQGHVWTAPAVQGKKQTDGQRRSVRSCVRPLRAARMAAGPDEIRGSNFPDHSDEL